ncbi:Uncharacterised protein [Mycobacteroides abscessus subsp. abscessus]|nr:Uncharacterised protein [Mycobacteroides abscessus subsp. abscessus]SIM59115.1 Uncharacterised protein [Mycobacteroides abscessus subsp. abscessus]SKU42768.1 Uncharacterised protein [Mycobacteroides abscessus subsp. abscessus]
MNRDRPGPVRGEISGDEATQILAATCDEYRFTI